MNFLEKSLNILSRDTISVLEIATYNTTGLKGAKEKVSSPFNNLVKSSGVSNKSDDAGGSFGIGKMLHIHVQHLEQYYTQHLMKKIY